MKFELDYTLKRKAKRIREDVFEQVRQPFEHYVYQENGLVVEAYKSVEGWELVAKTSVGFDSKEELAAYITATLKKLEQLVIE